MALLGSNICLILKPLPAIISSPGSKRSINFSLLIDTSETDPLYRLETKVIDSSCWRYNNQLFKCSCMFVIRPVKYFNVFLYILFSAVNNSPCIWIIRHWKWQIFFHNIFDDQTNNGFKHWTDKLTHVVKTLQTWAMEILKRSVMIHNPLWFSLNKECTPQNVYFSSYHIFCPECVFYHHPITLCFSSWFNPFK